MVADGLSIINADFSSTSFCVSPVTIGPHNFLGNSIAYPAQGKTGANCLLATKVLVPIDGEVRENVGLLGSPSFEIPRTVERDGSFDDLIAGDGLRKRLAAKNRHNIVTMGLYLFIRWLFFFALTTRRGAVADLYGSLGASVIAIANVVILLFGIAYWILVDRLVTLFLPVRPLFCSIYDRAFGDTNDSGRSRRGRGLSRSSMERRSRPRSGVCSVSGSAAGSSMTASG